MVKKKQHKQSKAARARDAAAAAIKALHDFIGRRQLAVVMDCCRSEEKQGCRQCFFDKLVELDGVMSTIETIERYLDSLEKEQ